MNEIASHIQLTPTSQLQESMSNGDASRIARNRNPGTFARRPPVQLAENDDDQVRVIPEADLQNLVIALLNAVDRPQPGPPVIPVREMKQT